MVEDDGCVAVLSGGVVPLGAMELTAVTDELVGVGVDMKAAAGTI